MGENDPEIRACQLRARKTPPMRGHLAFAPSPPTQNKSASNRRPPLLSTMAAIPWLAPSLDVVHVLGVRELNSWGEGAWFYSATAARALYRLLKQNIFLV